ncbi:hypothetical protein QUA81_03765 [Microcoleus sp. F6_B4]
MRYFSCRWCRVMEGEAFCDARSQAVKYLEHPLNRKLDLFEFHELP